MIDKSVKEKVLELNKQNKSLRDIATELGIGKSTVASIIKKSSVKLNEPEVKLNEPDDDIPKLIITEESKMDKSAASDFLNGLGSPANSSHPEPAMDFKKQAFLENFLSGLDDEPVKKKGRPPAKSKMVMPIFNEPAAPVVKAEPAVRQLEKGELIAKITLNVQTFPDVLADFIKPNKDSFLDAIQKKSQTELSAILSTMEYSRSVANTTNVMKQMTLTGAAMLELGTKRFLKMRTDGFADMIRNTPEFEHILKEISMENQGGIIAKYQSPTVRLTTLIITSLLAVDAKNRSGAANVVSSASMAPANLNEKYGDL
jgi:predicted DNA-binding protein YlxM (UPF0122 family)